MDKHRRLNKYFQQAISLTYQPYLDYHDLDQHYKRLSNLAYEYQLDVSDKVIILQCEYHPTEILTIDYVIRFSDKYTKKLESRLSRIKNYCSKFHRALFLTLTVDPKNHSSARAMKLALSQSWNRLATWLRKQYGIEYYIKTKEYTKSHIPHLHILLFHDDFIPVEKLRELWTKYSMGNILRLEFIQTKHILKDGQTITLTPINYILKYITKTYKDDTINDNTKIWQWALRDRAFSISRSLERVSLISAKTNSNSSTCHFYLLATLPLTLIDPHTHYTPEQINSILYSYYGDRG